MKIAVVDYGAGNIRSAVRAFEHVAGQVGIAAKVEVVTTPEAILAADRIVLPGDGAFADCIGALRSRTAMEAALEEAVRKRGRPFFGICVGMQLLATRGLEYGEHAGLGWIAGDVERITPSDPRLKVPHMGWNQVRHTLNHPLWHGIPDNSRFYFVHSYCVQSRDADVVAGTCHYGIDFSAALACGNVFAAQFHPEKSAEHGLQLLKNFVGWNGQP